MSLKAVFWFAGFAWGAYLAAPEMDSAPITKLEQKVDIRTVSQLPRLGAIFQPKASPLPSPALKTLQPQETDVQLPIRFEPNLGQAGDAIRFLCQGPGYSFLLLNNKLVFQFQVPQSKNEYSDQASLGQISVLRMKLVNGKLRPRIIGENELRSRSHYLRGQDPNNWQVNVPTFAKVRYQEIYPGIDMIFYGNRGQLEFDFRLKSGIDPSSIQLHFGGNGGRDSQFQLTLDKTGNLVLPTQGEDIRLGKPVAFQEQEEGRREIPVTYELRGGQEVGFRLGSYDKDLPLIIDPVLTYSTNGIGGSAIAVDRQGNSYVTGIANPAFLSAPGAFQDTHSEGTCFNGPNLVPCADILLAKLNANGTELIYSTFLGGAGFDYGYGIEVDFQGNAYLTGTTNSPDFPVTPNAFQSTQNRAHCASPSQDSVCSSAFVTKVNSTGTELLYSTYLGGESGGLGGNGIAIDSQGAAYVTGDRLNEGFVSKLHPEGRSVLYSVGGIGGTAIALDTQANAYLTGRSGNESYVTKLDADGTQILYAFRLGGNYVPYDALPQEVEALTDISVDSAGHAYVTGYTAYEDFPTTPGALFETPPGVGICGNSLCRDAFIAKLNPQGTGLIYSTYLGGTAIDYSNGIDVDARGNAYVTGVTLSQDFPITDSLGSPDGQIFVSKLNPAGTELVYSVRAGNGNRFEEGSGIAVAPQGTVSFTGQAGPNFPVTFGSYQALNGNKVFVAQVFQDLEVFVPIVLSMPGRNNSFFTSELTLVNRGTNQATLDFTYKAAFGGGSGSARDSLPSTRQRVIPDAINYLRQLGVPIPTSGSLGGTLTVRFSGLHAPSEGAVSVRTTTSVDGGRAGLAYPAVSTGFHQPTYLCGLRHNTQDRSNIAVQHMGASDSGEIILRLTVISGDPFNPGSFVLPEQTLLPGEFRQFSGVLRSHGISLDNGFVRVEKIQGAALYYAYAVVNDQASSDGSFIAPLPQSASAGWLGYTLPTIVDTEAFSSELIITNWSESWKIVGFSVLSDGISNPQVARFVTIRSNEQLVLPNVVNWLRRRGLPGLGLPGQVFTGPLYVTTEDGDGSGLFVGARTTTQVRGNRYGVFYAAVPYGNGPETSTWIYGLQQNSKNRSNLGLVNTGELNKETSVFRIEIYDGETGLLASTVEGITVEARKLIQIGSILERFVPGTRQGYARISRIIGTNPFLAFAVINDGGQPGERTGDGTFIYSVP